MSELFTQTDKQKKLFRTEEDFVANIQTQFGMPHTGKDLLLDAKMGPNKNQSSVWTLNQTRYLIQECPMMSVPVTHPESCMILLEVIRKLSPAKHATRQPRQRLL